MSERIDPLLGRPLTPAERAALDELMRELRLSAEDREAHPIGGPLRRIPRSPEESRALGTLAGLMLVGAWPPRR